MPILPSTKLLHRGFSTIVTCGIVFILFLVILSYNQPRSPFWQNYEEGTRIYPGEYLKNVSPDPRSQGYCKFNYKLPYNFSFSVRDIHGTPEEEWNSDYSVMYNVLEVHTAEANVPLVTYATHLTYEFFDYLVELVRYWDGFVSVAAFLPDGDPNPILEKIVHFCYCVPSMSKVSLHFVFPKSVGIRNRTAQIKKESFLKCDISLSVLKSSNTHAQNRKTWYPVNVCRNVARNAAFTKFVMLSDVELMPSKHLASNFLAMVNNYNCRNRVSCRHVVYVVPVFEIEASESIPRTKTQLLDLVMLKRAVYFHQHICTHCQKFPGLPKWLNNDPGDKIKPFVTAKREAPYHRWEPIYIGTKNDPWYNEALSWEGFQDKMLQMYEMCLMNYRLVVLDGAFLVHWPGMKKIKTPQEPWRLEYVRKNQRQYDAILGNLSDSYPPNHSCRGKN